MGSFIENIFKKKIGLFILALLAGAIPLTVYVTQQQQDIRQRAQVAPVTLKLNPQTDTIGLNDTQTIDVILNTGDTQINGVDIQVSFSQDTLEITNFQPSTSLTPVINNPPNNTNGTFRFVGVNANTSGPQLFGAVFIGSFTVKGKAVGTGTITFGNTLITSPAQNDGVTTSKTNGTYTVTQDGGGDNMVWIFFAKNGAEASQITIPQGTFSVDLIFETKSNVNGFDTTIIFGNNLTLQSVTDGADTSEFPSEIFKTINNQTRSLRYSRVTTNTSATNAGRFRFHIGKLNFQTTGLGTGTITFGTTLVTSPYRAGSLTIDTTPLSYTITNSQTTPTPTPPPSGGVELKLNLILTGIGPGGGNTSPRRPQRQVFVTVANRQGRETQTSGFVNFDKATGTFEGTVTLPASLPEGPYTIRVQSKQFLRKLVPSIQNLTGSEHTLPATVLVVGDINGDNKINILDYNEGIFACFGLRANTQSCKSPPPSTADLDDDGDVDGTDYNLFLLSLSVKEGD